MENPRNVSYRMATQTLRINGTHWVYDPENLVKENTMANGDACDSAEVPRTSGSAPVKIDKVANGFIVRIGCKTLVAHTWTEVSAGLALYWQNPAEAEKKYCK